MNIRLNAGKEYQEIFGIKLYLIYNLNNNETVEN